MQQLELNGITLCCDSAEQTAWGAVSVSTTRDTKIVLHSVSSKGCISHYSLWVVVVTPRVSNSGQSADLLEGRMTSPHCLFLPLPSHFISLSGVLAEV